LPIRRRVAISVKHKTRVGREICASRNHECRQDCNGHQRMRGGVHGMRLRKGRVRGRHALATILATLAAPVMVLRAGHAVTTLCRFVGRGCSKAVKRIHRKSRNQQRHQNCPRGLHHLKRLHGEGQAMSSGYDARPRGRPWGVSARVADHSADTSKE